jgi:hypothetical protein
MVMKQINLIIFGIIITVLLTVFLPTAVNAKSVFDKAIDTREETSELSFKAADVVDKCNSRTLAGDTEIIPICDRFAQSMANSMRQFFLAEETNLNEILSPSSMYIPAEITTIDGGTINLYILDTHWRSVASNAQQFLSVMNMCGAKLYDMSTMKLCTAEYEKYNDMMHNLFAIRALDMQTIMGIENEATETTTVYKIPD